MALLTYSLLIALMFLPAVESVADMRGTARDKNTENTYLQQNDDMKKLLEIVKSQGLVISKLEATLEKHEKILSDQEDTINDLKQIVEGHNGKLSELEANLKVRNIKIMKLQTDVEKMQRTCSHKTVFDKVVSKNRLDEADHKSDTVDKRQLPNENIKASSIRRTQREIRHISFSAYLSHLVENLGVGQTIKFDQVITNDGSAYNRQTGVFTVPVTGTYVFTFYVTSSSADATFLLKSNGHIQSSGVARPDNFGHGKDVQGGGTVILTLNHGVSVWVENRYSGGIIYSDSDYRWVTFSGFLLY